MAKWQGLIQMGGDSVINRCAVLIRSGKSYLEWARGLDDSGPLPDPNDEPTIYLIPEYGTPEEAWQLLEECFQDIFERELWAWHRGETDWPGDRDFKMFQEWFEIKFGSEIEDLCDFELVNEPEG